MLAFYPIQRQCESRTTWPLFLEMALQDPVDGFTSHLTRKHQPNFNLAIAPYQCRIDECECLRYEGQPCAQVGDGVGGVLRPSDLLVVVKLVHT
jgi:hypothetical protein